MMATILQSMAELVVKRSAGHHNITNIPFFFAQAAGPPMSRDGLNFAGNPKFSCCGCQRRPAQAARGQEAKRFVRRLLAKLLALLTIAHAHRPVPLLAAGVRQRVVRGGAATRAGVTRK